MHYSKLIQDTIDYININLTENLSLEILANNVYLSPYHFHRIFVKNLARTPMEYIRRKRLNSATKDLLKMDLSIIYISNKYRFDSLDGFCRAFKNYFGVTPNQYRNYNFMIQSQKRQEVKKKMYTFEIFNKMKCNFEEKTELLKTFNKIIELAKISKINGLLSLEEQINQVHELFFKKAIQMLIDGMDPNTIREILLNYCLTGKFSNKEFLKRILIIEGILLIQEGTNLHITIEKLSSYMGEDFIDTINKHFKISFDEKFEEVFENYKINNTNKTVKSKETTLLEKPFSRLDNRSLQRLLRDVDDYTIVRAILGASGNIQIKILSNLSKKSVVILLDEIELIKNTRLSDITECQNRILKEMNSLALRGEIVI